MKTIINILSIFAIFFACQITVVAGNNSQEFELTNTIVENSIEIENNLTMLKGIKYFVVVTDANDEVVSSQAFSSEEAIFAINCEGFMVGMHQVKIMTQGKDPIIIPVLKGGSTTTPDFETMVFSSEDEE